jgi:heme/copper-type cytochrome/quinol oxidase subunit 3
MRNTTRLDPAEGILMSATAYTDLHHQEIALQRPTIDVSQLPESVVDPKATAWWGNNLLLLIETAMFAILVACYLYYRNVDFAQWPPPHTANVIADVDPNPKLMGSTIELGVMLISLVPAIWVHLACMRHRRNERTVRVWIVVLLVLELISAALRFHGFSELHHRWNENAYGSVTWGILFLHLLHLFISAGETALMAIYLFVKGFDDKHARDIRISLIYWYWVVAIWVPLYALVYWGPRFL